MTREETVAVKLKNGVAGAVTFSAGQHCDLRLEPGQVATTWANGWPILREQFEVSLASTGLFELADTVADPAVREQEE